MAELEGEDSTFLGLNNDPKVNSVQVNLDMMDYDYVEKCSNVSELKAIFRRLKSGEVGCFPHLETTVENKIMQLLTSKERERIMAMRHGPTDEERKDAVANIGAWLKNLNEYQADDVFNSDVFLYDEKVNRNSKKDDETSISQVFMPVDSSLKINLVKQGISKEKLSNKEYFKAWDKFDSKAEEEKLDREDEMLVERNTRFKVSLEDKINRTKVRQAEELRQLQEKIQSNSFSVVERRCLAETEKYKGNEYFKCGDFEDALNCYSISIAYDNTNAIVYSNRALTMMRLGNMKQALLDATSAIDLDPSFLKARIRRAMIHHQCGRYENAIWDFEECVKLDPTNSHLSRMLECAEKKWRETRGEKTQVAKQRIRVTTIKEHCDVNSAQTVFEANPLVQEVETSSFKHVVIKNAKKKKNLDNSKDTNMIEEVKTSDYQDNTNDAEEEVLEEFYTPGAQILLKSKKH